jgi:hypothetical protein
MWNPSNVSNVIKQNLMNQDKIENILDKIFFEFSKLLITKFKLTERKKIDNVILNNISEINDYKIKENKNYKIKDCKSIFDIVNILNIYNVNFRVWTKSDIVYHIENYIKVNKKRKIDELLI